MRRGAAVVAGVLLLLLAVGVSLRGCRSRRAVSVPLTPVPAASVTPVAPSTSTAPSVTTVLAPAASSPLPSPSARPRPRASTAPSVVPAGTPPPHVQIHKELIPKDIEIVRVHYASSLSGPSSTIPFDLNGSGFTPEFERMIRIESGHPGVSVTGLSLVTLNQIHGTLTVSSSAATMVAFPHVLIRGSVVFQAPEPFAVIRPGDVLNLVFTEMGESGRMGRFRVFTNLTSEMFSTFSVESSTPAIQMGDLTPQLPFVVDGSIAIGAATGGDYGIRVKIGERTAWSRDGIIRVVRPNVGQNGLVQRIEADDGFHRPGDVATFLVQGSGFQPGDVGSLRASSSLSLAGSTFSFVSPGRLRLAVQIPSEAKPGAYGLEVLSGTESLIKSPAAFEVVPPDWARGVELREPLTAGATATLVLVGRDFDPAFVASLKTETDTDGLAVDRFVRQDARQATARITASPTLAPGEYLLKITSNGKTVSPRNGSLIQVAPAR